MRRAFLAAILWSALFGSAYAESSPPVAHTVQIVFVGFNFEGRVALWVNGQPVVDQALRYHQPERRISLVRRNVVLRSENDLKLLVNGYPRAHQTVAATDRTRTVYIYNGREAVGFEASESATIAPR